MRFINFALINGMLFGQNQDASDQNELTNKLFAETERKKDKTKGLAPLENAKRTKLNIKYHKIQLVEEMYKQEDYYILERKAYKNKKILNEMSS